MIKPYNRTGCEIILKDDLVYKTDPIRLDSQWRSQMEQIINIWDLPAFRGFIDNGYVTKYIRGTDLHGTPVFMLDGSCPPCIINEREKLDLIDIFANAINTGKRLGFTLGDITIGNILTDGAGFYLIDYDSIVSYPLADNVFGVWNHTLQTIFGK